VQALLRRTAGQARTDDVLVDEHSGVRMELATRRVLVEGEPVDVSPVEWRLLLALEQHRGQVLAPEQLLELPGTTRSA
jgi:DNA-binding response OmpR family regulator